jgi:hypothetical protein
MVADQHGRRAHAFRLVRQQIAALSICIIRHHKSSGWGATTMKHLQHLESFGPWRCTHVQNLQESMFLLILSQHDNMHARVVAGYRVTYDDSGVTWSWPVLAALKDCGFLEQNLRSFNFASVQSGQKH